VPGIDYEEIFSRFNEARESIMLLVQEVAGLSESNRRSARRYLEDFYEVINDPGRAKREIIDACRRLG
jgi:hypothetical protein